jgi:hypothetical protein
LHPIDRLAVLRQQAADIRREIATIRDQIIAGEIGRIGDHYTATVAPHIHLTPVPAETATIDWHWQPSWQDNDVSG